MNSKVFIIIVVVALASIIGIITVLGQTIFDVSGDGFFSIDNPEEIFPIDIQLDDITVLETSDRESTVLVEFIVTNPNQKSVILPFITYQLYEKDVRVHIGEIGKRLDSMVVGSDYVTLLYDTPVVIRDEIKIKNTGNTPEFWEALSTNTAEWKIVGEATYSLSSMVAGGQQEINFEFSI